MLHNNYFPVYKVRSIKTWLDKAELGELRADLTALTPCG